MKIIIRTHVVNFTAFRQILQNGKLSEELLIEESDTAEPHLCIECKTSDLNVNCRSFFTSFTTTMNLGRASQVIKL